MTVHAAPRQAGYIGKPLRRREDARFVRGKGLYVDDVALPGLAWCAFVRSPHAHEGRFLEAFLESGAGGGVPAAARKPCPGGSDREPSRRQLRRRCAERAQNRHGGAPRGAVPVARDGPRYANVASRHYGRDRIKDTASRRSAIPSVGDRKLRRGRENPGARMSRERRNGRHEFRRMG